MSPPMAEGVLLVLFSFRTENKEKTIVFWSDARHCQVLSDGERAMREVAAVTDFLVISQGFDDHCHRELVSSSCLLPVLPCFNDRQTL